MAESEEELKSLLMKVKKESEKAGLKLNIQKMKIMAFSPITSWQVDGEKVETVTNIFHRTPKSLWTMTAAMERHLLLGRKSMINLDSILKSIDITLPTKIHIVKAMIFPVVMYGSESWTIKKAECLRIDAFKLGCLRTLLRVPWTVKRSNQSVLKEINTDYSLEGLMLKLKLHCFRHWLQRVDSLEKILLLGMIEGKRRKGRQRMRCLESITDSMNMYLNKLWETVKDREDWHAAVPQVAESRHCLAIEQYSFIKHENF